MKKVGFIVKLILFNLLLVLTLVYMNYVFRNKEYEGAQDLFAKWNPNHSDVVFIGNSHQFCSIDPDLLYEEYGIESFMLATSSQTIPMSYYAAMEAIELHKPDKIVLEVSYAANDYRTLAGMDHCFFDGFPRCKARTLALEDLVDKEDRIYYLFPLGMYHSRWKELTSADFAGFPLSERGGVHKTERTVNSFIPLVEREETEPMPAEMEKYMDLLIDLCRDNGVELILYVTPFNALNLDDVGVMDIMQRQRIFNYVGEYAKNKNVRFYNFFYEIEQIGIDNETDWLDTQHFNVNGQTKFTRYFVERGCLD